MATLKTNYKDDILDTSVNTQRKYRMANNADGTISLEDVTVYTQNGDTFGASEVNQIHAAVNLVNESLSVIFNELESEVLTPFVDINNKPIYHKCVTLSVSANSQEIILFTDTLSRVVLLMPLFSTVGDNIVFNSHTLSSDGSGFENKASAETRGNQLIVRATQDTACKVHIWYAK